MNHTTTQFDYTLVLRRGKHTYILTYDDATAHAAMMELARWAYHPELNFDWKNAAALSQEIRNRNQVTN